FEGRPRMRKRGQMFFFISGPVLNFDHVAVWIFEVGVPTARAVTSMIAPNHQDAAKICHARDCALVFLPVRQHVPEVGHSPLDARQTFLARPLLRASSRESPLSAGIKNEEISVATRRCKGNEGSVLDVHSLHSEKASVKSERFLNVSNHQMNMEDAFPNHHTFLLGRR